MRTPSLDLGMARRSVRRLLTGLNELPAWWRVLVAVLLVVAVALAFPRGGPGASVVVIVCFAIAVAAAWIVADPADRRWVLFWLLLALAAREVLVGAIDLALLSRGLKWYAPDERIYITKAFDIWQHWSQPAAPFNDADSYVASSYVHGMARLYTIFGENIVVVKLVNTLLGVLTALFGYRTMRNLGMPGARWALVLLVSFPSIALWSALTLKDSYVIFFLIGSLLAASEFIRGRNPLWLAVALLGLLPLETVRLYMFVTGAIALLAVSVALSQWRARLITGVALLMSVYVLFAIEQPFKDLGSNIFYIPIVVRSASAAGAKSSFVEPVPAVQGEWGQRITIGVSGSTPEPGTTPRVIEVQPGTALVFEKPGATAAPRSTGASPTPAVVRPGDVIVIGSPPPSPGASPAPTTAGLSPGQASPSPSPLVVVLQPDARNTVGLASQSDPDQTSFQGSLETNARHLPIGVLYTLFAPFPWVANSLEQVATIPEMVIWYACLVLAGVGFMTLFRRRDFRYAHGAAAIVGLVIVLSLIGSNTGTLLRSRAMLIPYVLLLTGVGVEVVLGRYPRLAARWRGPGQSPS